MEGILVQSPLLIEEETWFVYDFTLQQVRLLDLLMGLGPCEIDNVERGFE